MILKVAEGFFDMGQTLEERENLLQLACSVWNIACFESPKQHEFIERYINKFREVNHHPEEVCRDLREDMLRLMEQKDKLYPKTAVRILHSDISVEDGKEHVVILSTPFSGKCEQQLAPELMF